MLHKINNPNDKDIRVLLPYLVMRIIVTIDPTKLETPTKNVPTLGSNPAYSNIFVEYIFMHG